MPISGSTSYTYSVENLYVELTDVNSAFPGAFGFAIDWGDGSPLEYFYELPMFFGAHTYDAPGEYTPIINVIDSGDNIIDSASFDTPLELSAESSTTSFTDTTTSTSTSETSTTNTSTSSSSSTTQTTGTGPPTPTTGTPIGPPGCQPCLPAPIATTGKPSIVMPTTRTVAPVIVTTTPTPDVDSLTDSIITTPSTSTTVTTTVAPTSTSTSTDTTASNVAPCGIGCNRLGF